MGMRGTRGCLLFSPIVNTWRRGEATCISTYSSTVIIARLKRMWFSTNLEARCRRIPRPQLLLSMWRGVISRNVGVFWTFLALSLFPIQQTGIPCSLLQRMSSGPCLRFFHAFRFLAFPLNCKGPLPEPLFIENSGRPLTVALNSTCRDEYRT